MMDSGSVPKNITSYPRISKATIVGREDLVHELRNILAIEKKAVLLKGVEGIGKTTTAALYVNSYCGEYDHIVWLNACESLEEAIMTNHQLMLNLDILQVRAEHRVETCLRQLSSIHSEKPGLFVLDDVNVNLSAFYDLLPESSSWHILLTSKERLSRFINVEVGVLQENESVKLFQNYCKGYTSEQVQGIIGKLEPHPFLIEVLAKSFCAGKITYESAEKFLDANSSKGIINTVFEQSQEERIKGLLSLILEFNNPDQRESWLLNQFLALPSFCIERNMLKRFIQVEKLDWSESFDTVLEGLSCKGFICYDEHSDQFKMHELMQKAVLNSVKITPRDVLPVIEQVTVALQDYDKPENAAVKFNLFRYGEAILKLFPNVSSKEISQLKNNLALVYKTFGEFERARELMEEALKSDLENLGETHPDIAVLQSSLAQIYRDLGEFEEARELFESALQSDIENFGDSHPNISQHHSHLAHLYQDLGEYEKARDMLENSLKFDLRNYAPHHPFISKTQSNLAAIYKNLGDPVKAKDLLEKSLATDLKNFGEHHPSISVSRANLATIYRDLGENEKARDLLEAALQSDILNLGEKHPDVAIRQTILANVYSGLGEHEKAKSLWEKALRTNIEYFGQTHPNVALCQSNLAGVHSSLGEYEKTRDLLEEALKSDLINFGEKHPYVALCQSNLANTYYDLGEYENSSSLFEKTLSLHREIYEHDHPFTVQVQSNLANVYADMGEFELAKELLELNIVSNKKKFGTNHPNVAASESNLANLFADFGETEKARDLWLSAYQILLENFGQDHPDTIMVKGFLDGTSSEQG